MTLGIAGLILQIFFYSPKPEGNELWVHTKFNHLLKAHFSPLSYLSRQLKKSRAFLLIWWVHRQSGGGRIKLCGKTQCGSNFEWWLQPQFQLWWNYAENNMHVYLDWETSSIFKQSLQKLHKLYALRQDSI